MFYSQPDWNVGMCQTEQTAKITDLFLVTISFKNRILVLFTLLEMRDLF